VDCSIRNIRGCYTRIFYLGTDVQETLVSVALAMTRRSRGGCPLFLVPLDVCVEVIICECNTNSDVTEHPTNIACYIPTFRNKSLFLFLENKARNCQNMLRTTKQS